MHVASTADVNILLDADTNSTLPNSRPQIEFAYAGDTKAFVGMSRNYDDFSNNIYPDALVIINDKLPLSSSIVINDIILTMKASCQWFNEF